MMSLEIAHRGRNVFELHVTSGMDLQSRPSLIDPSVSMPAQMVTDRPDRRVFLPLLQLLLPACDRANTPKAAVVVNPVPTVEACTVQWSNSFISSCNFTRLRVKPTFL